MNRKISGTSASVASRMSIACDHRPVSLILAAAAAPAARRFVVHVTPEMIRHSRLLDVLYFVDFVYGLAVLYIILRTGASTRLRNIASRAVKWPLAMAALYFVLLSAVTTALEFPLWFYQG